MFALINMVAFDAIVASHEAKYHYWLLRPTMADPAITLAIGLPNFPSYPSNHAAISAGMARILGHVFPAEKVRLDAHAEEAAFSRVLGGIHFRFDGEAGLELGRQVAAWASPGRHSMGERVPQTGLNVAARCGVADRQSGGRPRGARSLQSHR